MVEKLGINFKDARMLNQIIEHELPMGPQWTHRDVNLVGDTRTHDLYYRDIGECIKELYSNPTFADSMKYAPERHYTDSTKMSRMYRGVHTGDWMWKTQVCSVLVHVGVSSVVCAERNRSWRHRLAADFCYRQDRVIAVQRR